MTHFLRYLFNYINHATITLIHHVFISELAHLSSPLLFRSFLLQLSALESVLTWDLTLGKTEQTGNQLK